VSAFWCELAWLGDAEPAAGVVIEAGGERIGSVRVGVAEPPPGAIRLAGLTLPGLANAHSHAFQRTLRGRTQRVLGGSFWTWREQMYELAATAGSDPARLEAVARATFAEMALAGISLVGEFDYLHCSDAIVRAAHDAGIRLTLIDACYLEGGIPAFRDASAEAWALRVLAIELGDRARLGAAIHSVRAVDPAGAAIVSRFARDRQLPLHAHVSEQPAEIEASLRRYGATPANALARLGAVGPDFTAVHATHLTPDERAILAGSFSCLCPTTERDLADGIGEPPGRLALGSDSNALIDLFEEARAVELDRRLGTLVRGTYDAVTLATAATANGYASLGWPEGGRIEPGALCDLVTVGLDGVRLAGTRPTDALDAVIFAGAAADVTHLCVGGRVVVAAGRHADLDVPGELAAAIAALS
jgi:formiminoglutamate deiminase